MKNQTPSGYVEVCLLKSPSGFGEWQRTPDGGEGMDYSDILQAAGELGELYRLGEPELPVEIEDIRGRIHDEPEEVWALRARADLPDGQPDISYFGIEPE